MTNGNARWSADQETKLRDGLARGLSCGQIAVEIGGITRNAVIGKAGRLGLSLARKPKAAKPKRERVRLYDNTGTAPQTPAKPRRWVFGTGVSKPPSELTDLVAAPSPTAVGIMELTAESCRWPVEGDGAAMLYCGAASVEGYSYCSAHVKRAFRPRDGDASQPHP